VVREAVAGVFVPLESQERGRWDRPLIERGIAHLGRSATGDRMSRWHLEAGIACEHVIAPSVRETEWERVVSLYDLWLRESPDPVVALNRALAVAERDGVYEGRRAQDALAGDRRLSGIRSTGRPGADLERRAGRPAAARAGYERAIAVARSSAERLSYERRLELLVSGSGHGRSSSS
jgi:predicted RNA polymerase sigma factor